MGTAFVPDWDPTIKLRARDPSPWGDTDTPMNFTSTYQQHYQMGQSFVPRARTPILPRMGGIFSTDPLGNNVPRSTSQDSFQSPPLFPPAPLRPCTGRRLVAMA